MPKNKDLLDKLKMKSKPEEKNIGQKFADFLKLGREELDEKLHKYVQQPAEKAGYGKAGSMAAALIGSPFQATEETIRDLSSGDKAAWAGALVPALKGAKIFKQFGKLEDAVGSINPRHQERVTDFLSKNPKIAKEVEHLSPAELSSYIDKNKDAIGKESTKMLRFLRGGKRGGKEGFSMEKAKAEAVEKKAIDEGIASASKTTRDKADLMKAAGMPTHQKAQLTPKKQAEVTETIAKHSEKWNAPVETVMDKFKKSSRKNIKQK